MKKFILFLLCVTALSMEGFAQKGMNSVGIDIPVGYGKKNVWTGLGIKYQYNITNFFRVEPTFSLFPIYSTKHFEIRPNSDYTFRIEWQAFANCHLFVQNPKTIRPFFILGAGVIEISTDPTISTIRHNLLFALNGGIGLDIRLAYHWSMQIKGLAIFPTDNYDDLLRYSRVLVNGSIGLAYNF